MGKILPDDLLEGLVEFGRYMREMHKGPEVDSK
jgi:hypothetical protein